MNTINTKTKNHSFEKFALAEESPGLPGEVASQLMMMYRKTAEKRKPVVLELGTDVGASTTVFLQACEEQDGRVVSVDIVDCSGISDSPRWQFVRSSSTDVANVLAQAPHLRAGIDILYVDSLHTRDHVENEVTGWYPYLNAGAWIFFDDVDSHPYRKGNRKDNLKVELANDSIHDYVKEFFYSNEEFLRLHILYGTTGLACLRKMSPLGTPPIKAAPVPHRTANVASNSLIEGMVQKTKDVLGRLSP